MINPATKRKLNLKSLSSKGKSLIVPLKIQEQTEWCWAGCTEMILHYYGVTNVRQCNMANWLFKQTNCCNSPAHQKCNRPCIVKDVKRVFGNWGIKCNTKKSQVSYSILSSEINNNRPSEVAFFWNVGGGHVVVVSGWKPNQRLTVLDPWYGYNNISYSSLQSAYGSGSWRVTWTGFGR